MPTLLRAHGYRFYFYSHETDEPPHVHVDQAGRTVKFWLESVTVVKNRGFAPVELRKIERIINVNRTDFLRRWDEFFDPND